MQTNITNDTVVATDATQGDAAAATSAAATSASTLSEEKKKLLCKALEARAEAERGALKRLSGRQLAPPRDNRGKVRAVVMRTHNMQWPGESKTTTTVTFQVLSALVEGVTPGAEIRNGKGALVAKTAADGLSIEFHFTSMEIQPYLATWRSRNMDVLDETGGNRSLVVRPGDTLSMRIDCDHGPLPPFTIATFGLAFTVCASDPAKPLREGELPSIRVSRAIKDCAIERTASAAEIVRLFRTSPSLLNLPIPSVEEIFRRNGYKHQHVANGKNESSKEVVYLPLMPSPEATIELFGDGAGVMIVAEEDVATESEKSAANQAQNTVRSAWYWQKHNSPEQHQLARLKLTLIQYASPDEYLAYASNAIGATRFPRLTAQVPIYDNQLAPLKINDLEMWKRIARAFFASVAMFVPANFRLYEMGECPANRAGDGRFESQHLFLYSQELICDLVGELVAGAGLPVSHRGAEALLDNGRLFRSEALKSTMALARYKPGEAVNMNELPQDEARRLTHNPDWCFYALHSTPAVGEQRAMNRAIGDYLRANPKQAGGELLLWEKWNRKNFDDYCAVMHTKNAAPEYDTATNPIAVEKLSTLRTPTGDDTFVLFAFQKKLRAAIEREAEAGTGQLAEVFKSVAAARQLLITQPPQLQITGPEQPQQPQQDGASQTPQQQQDGAPPPPPPTTPAPTSTKSMKRALFDEVLDEDVDDKGDDGADYAIDVGEFVRPAKRAARGE